MKVTALTCTGDRPEAFKLCLRWMESQKRKPDEWIIIDDGINPLSIVNNGLPKYANYIRREPKINDPKHTMNVNILTALPHIKGDYILFFEDDDYYSPSYIETTLSYMGIAEKSIGDNVGMGGYRHAKYYHLPTGKFCVHPNNSHASLAQTIITKDVLTLLQTILEHNAIKWPLDMCLWLTWSKYKALWDDKDKLFCSMKGLPGRKGISSGHDGDEGYYFSEDTLDRAILRDLIAGDYKSYLELLK